MRALRLLLPLAVFAAPQLPYETLFAPASRTNPRNSEADVIVHRDGRVTLAWTEFYGDANGDWGAARIAARTSRDRGQSWGPRFTLQENIGQMNVMEPDLLRLASGKVLFLFCRKNSPADCRPMVRLSTDDGRSFSPPREMAITPAPSYTGFNHDRAIQLRTGRILMPVFYTSDYRVDPHIKSRVYYSDDEGQTWTPSKTILDLPHSKAGAQEPGVVELKDGRVLLWLRTDLGRMYVAHSADGGETFSAPQPTEVVSPLSPQSIKRHPVTGDLVLIWNASPSRRTPLAAAVSKDEGRTWSGARVLDATPDATFAYTSLEWLFDRALLTYYQGPAPGVRGTQWSLKLKAVPLHWFYR
jgi:sialidase-1